LLCLFPFPFLFQSIRRTAVNKIKTLTNKNIIILFAIITGIPLLIYANTLPNTFVYDDYLTVTNNHFIREWRYFSDLFTGKYPVISNELTYRPVVTASYFADYALWGLKPAGYHLTNIIIHTINVALVYLLALRIFKQYKAAFISSLIFSLHPIFTEAVNAVSYREDLLSATFLLISFILFLRSETITGRIHFVVAYSFSLLACFFALLSKEMAITLPLLIFLYDFIFVRGKKDLDPQNDSLFILRMRYFRRRFITRYAGFVAVSGFYLFLRFSLFRNPGETMAYPENSIYVNFLTMLKVLAYYIKLLFLPVPLNADYVVPPASSFTDKAFLLCVVLLVASAVIIMKYRNNKALVFPVIWFFVSLLPVLNIIPILNIMAERYLYIPGIGFAMFAGLVVARIFKKNYNKKIYCAGVLGIFCLLFSYLTVNRNRVWFDEYTFSTATIRRSPKSFRVYNDLGYFYYRKGQIDKAIRTFKSSIQINPNQPKAHCNLGAAYSIKGMNESAIDELKTAIRLREQYPQAHNNLGLIYKKKGMKDKAVDEYRKALETNPYFAEAHNNLGSAYIQQGRLDEAQSELKKAIKIRRDFALAQYNLAVVYFKKGLTEKAYNKLLDTYKLDPSNADIHLSLGVIYKDYFHDNKKALYHLKKSLSLKPHHKQAKNIQKTIRELQEQLYLKYREK